MSVDLTQFANGDDILVTFRATVSGDEAVLLWGRGDRRIPLGHAVKAEHVPPQIEPGAFYVAGSDVYVGGPGGVLVGPLTGEATQTYFPQGVAKIRGLRRAEVRPVVPA